MAMRGRDRGSSAAGSRRATRSGLIHPVYEDFRPVSDWQQDDESHNLNIYLPGFMKEQIRVTTEGRNTIRVRGERLVAGNKWSRFLEDFQVPGDGAMDSIRAKFQRGILRITVVKERVGKEDALPPETGGVGDIQKQPTPQKGGVKAVPDVKRATESPYLLNDPERRRDQDDSQEKPIPQKGQSAEEKSFDPLKASAESINKLDLNDDQRGRTFTPIRNTRDAVSHNTEEKESRDKASLDPTKAHDQDGDQKGRIFTQTSTRNAKKESIETKEKYTASERSGDETKDELHKTMGSSELPEAKTTKTRRLEKDGATDIPEKDRDNKIPYGASEKKKHMNAMKGFTELDEERNLLVNMGVAMLVIMALTAYVTYNFASAKI